MAVFCECECLDLDIDTKYAHQDFFKLKKLGLHIAKKGPRFRITKYWPTASRVKSDKDFGIGLSVKT